MKIVVVTGGVVHRTPNDLKQGLLADEKALLLWEGLTPLSRNEWICWVMSVAKAETRKMHVRRVITELKEGRRRPCCFLGCIHRTDKKISSSVAGILRRRGKLR